MKGFIKSPIPVLSRLDDYPMGSSCPSFHIVEGNAGWRVFRPVIEHKGCVKCFRCYFVCPDAAIHQDADGAFQIDYDFCKGCGICAYECKPKAIAMIKEAKDE